MQTYHSSAEILAEDTRRRSRLAKPVDPVTGLNAGGDRFLLHLSDCLLSDQYLPHSMSSEPLIVRLLAEGSVAPVARCLGKTPDEVIESMVRLRFRHDFPFWAAMTALIKNKGGGADIHFRLNRAQRRLVASFEEARVAGQPIRIILLKARQWGGSTCTQLYMSWLQLMHSTGLNSLILLSGKTLT